EEGEPLERRRQARDAAIDGHLALPCVHGQLRSQGDGADAVPPRDEVALHLDVPQDLLEGAAVARQQGLVDAAALLAEPAVGQPARWAALTPSLSVKALDELAS